MIKVSQKPGIHYWFLLCSCCFLPFGSVHSNPFPGVQSKHAKLPPDKDSYRTCAHETITELIQSSPVIIKALGAHIFTGSNPLSFSHDGHSSTTQRTQMSTEATEIKPSKSTNLGSDNNDDYDDNQANAMFITLTPETIYKGASLLKMSPSSEAAIRSGEASPQIKRQLNATLQPLSCFDMNVLKMLPTELIVFGKLVTAQQLQQQKQQQIELRKRKLQSQQQQQEGGSIIREDAAHGSDPQQQYATDLLRISINGLHRWSSQFENYVWKHLGWDDWSDFTLCSVTCGKGVQQRFRRCLLDNLPMTNLHMNLNLNLNAADDELESKIVRDADDDSDNNIYNKDDDEDDATKSSVDDEIVLVENLQWLTGSAENTIKLNSMNNYVRIGYEGHAKQSKPSIASLRRKRETARATHQKSEARNSRKMSITTYMDDDGSIHQKRHLRKQWASHSKGFHPNELNAIFRDNNVADDVNDNFSGVGGEAGVDERTKDNGDDDNYNSIYKTVMEYNIHSEEMVTTKTPAAAMTITNIQAANSAKHRKHRRRKFHRKRRKHTRRREKIHKTKTKKKLNKSISTLSCEGFNIEQRNCNNFECSDDISELLKFYKKPYNYSEDHGATSSSSSPLQTITNNFRVSPPSSPSFFASSLEAGGTSTGLLPSPTPLNMGWVKNWPNSINFTIMITLRVKNDTKTTAKIFSIRNSTHNLYLEPSREGMRLYLERNNTTEMLAVKFDLYDYRWHQVSISVQNGDLVSVFIDCSWRISFIVSKHLISLPLESDVEIGRGFNGDLQQLLVLPGNQNRHQCSSVRTSINEVKRYIIDTFIDDYSN